MAHSSTLAPKKSMAKGLRYALVIFLLASWGPLFRSIIDKLWMHSDGLPLVGQWAQFQTLADLIGAPVGAGIGIGLTILTAQTEHPLQRYLLIASCVLGLLITLPLLILVFIFHQDIARWAQLPAMNHPELITAALGGWLSTVAVQISAYLLGKEQHFKALLIMVVSSLPVLLTLFIGSILMLPNLIQITLLASVLSGVIFSLWLFANTLQILKEHPHSRAHLRSATLKLRKFIGAGFAIGILTPLSVMIARSAIASDLDWNSVGIATALWRVSDWVLCAAQAVLYFHFLPLLSKSAGDQLQRRLIKVIFQVFIPSVLALLLLLYSRQMVFPLLYSSQLEVNWKVCLLFWSGDAMRILAIIFLMALYILHRTRTISVVELFSQPLLALLLTLGAAQSLIWVGMAHLFTYTVYASLCFLGVVLLWFVPEKNRGAQLIKHHQPNE